MVLSNFSHQNAWHLGLNMLALYSFMDVSVHYLGKEQFLALYASGGKELYLICQDSLRETALINLVFISSNLATSLAKLPKLPNLMPKRPKLTLLCNVNNLNCRADFSLSLHKCFMGAINIADVIDIAVPE